MKPGRTGKEPPHVALIVETSMVYGREILRGVSQYIRENGPWTVYLEHRSLQDPEPPWLQNWQGRRDHLRHGLVALLVDSSPWDSHSGPQRPGDFDEAKQEPKLDKRRPHIESDHRAIGALAAEHLLERGFSHFAYFGYSGFAWSRAAGRGFSRAVRAAGHDCHFYQYAQRVSWNHQLPAWEAEVDGASQWISALPKPLGLMACNDFRGLQAARCLSPGRGRRARGGRRRQRRRRGPGL